MYGNDIIYKFINLLLEFNLLYKYERNATVSGSTISIKSTSLNTY